MLTGPPNLIIHRNWHLRGAGGKSGNRLPMNTKGPLSILFSNVGASYHSVLGINHCGKAQNG